MAALLYDELLKLYCQFSREGDENDESFDANSEALDALQAAIIKLAAPKTVLDVMALPDRQLKKHGLIHLIETDASDKYDQIDGFIECVFVVDVEAMITQEQYAFNGYDFCEWILQKGL